MAVLIDSSILVAIERRGTPTLGSDLLESLPLDSLLSSVTIMELAIGEILADTGARRVARATFAARVLGRFAVVPFDAREARAAAELFVELRRAGTPIGERDLMIAATAVANGHSLVTLNTAEFSRIPGLDILPDPLGPQPGSA